MALTGRRDAVDAGWQGGEAKFSRGVGNRIGRYFIGLAKKDMAKFFIDLPDADLAYLPQGTDNFRDYVEAVWRMLQTPVVPACWTAYQMCSRGPSRSSAGEVK